MFSVPQNLQTNFSIGIIPSPFFLYGIDIDAEHTCS